MMVGKLCFRFYAFEVLCTLLVPVAQQGKEDRYLGFFLVSRIFPNSRHKKFVGEARGRPANAVTAAWAYSRIQILGLARKDDGDTLQVQHCSKVMDLEEIITMQTREH